MSKKGGSQMDTLRQSRKVPIREDYCVPFVRERIARVDKLVLISRECDCSFEEVREVRASIVFFF